MPTDVINKNIKIKSGESSFSIKLNQKYDEQYKDLSLISIKEGSNPITDFSKDEQNANEIIVRTSPITSDKTIIVSINSKEIETFARNFCKERGRDFAREFSDFMKQMNY